MNRDIFRATLAVTVAAMAISTTAHGQMLGRATQPDWNNAGGDAQRTNWQRTDQTINPETAGGLKHNYSSPDQMPGFGLQIRRKLDNVSRGLSSISGGVTLSNANLGENRVYFGASDNRVIGFDPDIGLHSFNRKFDGANPAGTLSCPGASVATPARPGSLTVAATPAANTVQAVSAGRAGSGSFLAEPGVGLPNQRPPGARVITPPGFVAPAAPPGAAAGPGRSGAGAPGAAPGTAPGGAAAAAGAGRGGAAAPAAPQVATRQTRNFNVVVGAAGLTGQTVITNNTGFGVAAGNVYAISNDGRLRHLTNFLGLDALAPIPFLRPGAQPTDLIVLSNVLYTSTVNGCGGQANGVYSISVTQSPRGPGSQLGSPTLAAAGRGGAGLAGATPAPAAPSPPVPVPGDVKAWTTGGTSNPSSIAFVGPAAAEAGGGAPAAPAAAPAPTIGLVATSGGTGQYADSVVALNVADLSVKAVFTAAGADFATAPVIFRAGETAFAAVQARDGRIFLFNAETLDRPLVTTAPAPGLGGYRPAGLSFWQESSGQRWLLSTTANSVIAHKLSVAGQNVTLSQGWTLAGLRAPLTPIIVNGVVFAASSGEFVPAAGANPSAAARARNSGRAVLYALDGATGAKLWDSGTTITSFIPRTAGLWSTMGQVMFGTYDNYVYAFGTNMERHSSRSIENGY